MTEYIFINNIYADAKKALSPISSDCGFLFGDGLFETMRARNGNIPAFGLHLDRLFSSMIQLRYNADFFTPEIIRSVALKLLLKNNLLGTDAYIKIVVTRSSYGHKLIFDPKSKPGLIIFARKLKGYPDSFYKTGINVFTCSIKRNALGNDIYRHKLINYFENVSAKNEASANQAQEALFATRDKVVLEGATSNLFIVKDGTVFTPPLTQNILPGITRQLVIDICCKYKIKFAEKRIHYFNLLEADELFLTNSIMEIMPVKRVDSYDIGPGEVPGQLTAKILTSYRLMFY
jgi:branched-subunit amino acid aminotransferase/4-amino-4-deoxychorismate lyase